MNYEPLDLPIVWATVPGPKYEVWIGFDSLHSGEGGEHQHFRGVATVVTRLAHPRVRCVRSRKVGISKTVRRKVLKSLRRQFIQEVVEIFSPFFPFFLFCFTALQKFIIYFYTQKKDARDFFQQSLIPFSVLISVMEP